MENDIWNGNPGRVSVRAAQSYDCGSGVIKWVKPLTLIGVGGFLYVLIELAFRGRSHWTMFLVGGLCLPFAVLWFFLSAVGIVLDDYLRYFLFGEENPHYRLM